MQTITTIGLDLAKSVFQVHGVDGTNRTCRGGLATPLLRVQRTCRASRDTSVFDDAVEKVPNFFATNFPPKDESRDDVRRYARG